MSELIAILGFMALMFYVDAANECAKQNKVMAFGKDLEPACIQHDTQK